MNPSLNLQLREIQPSDLPIFFEHQQDYEAVYMAAFTSKDPTDREAFDSHWARILNSDAMVRRTIVVDGVVAGHIILFPMDDDLEITYWLGRDYWGKGIATKALASFLAEVDARPINARVAKDNIGSKRVLEKCGFEVIGESRWFANARNAEIDELILKLDK